MKYQLICVCVVAVCGGTLASSASAQAVITRFEFVDGGGIVQSAGHQITGSIGQGLVGAATSGTFTVNAGFWFNPNPVTPPGDPRDFNGDGVVDPDDLADFISGFFGQPADPRTDFNGDGIVDPDDLADYISAFFG